MTTLLQDIHDFEERTRQLKFVREHLEKHGSITLYECRYGGIPGYGIVPHPGARIFDLRQEGYVIKTLRNPTEWKLISKPEEAGWPSLTGFLAHLRTIGVEPEQLTPAKRADLYQEYAHSIV